ncbi:hypothetical protein T4C_582 [Trichinella pseudospiralis]|uniref:Uncharacterized protein n=1 Tax=Trichinella pseudospiralis TaxID=6337 RepID=A0A0V1HV41_TRIPS|nr:hypothetical protein T4C_582 [Trichinella pseudospiralis]
MKRCCFCSNPEDIVTPKEKRSLGVAPFISLGIIPLKLISI